MNQKFNQTNNNNENTQKGEITMLLILVCLIYCTAGSFHKVLILAYLNSLSKKAMINSKKYLLWAYILCAPINIRQNEKHLNFTPSNITRHMV